MHSNTSFANHVTKFTGRRLAEESVFVTADPQLAVTRSTQMLGPCQMRSTDEFGAELYEGRFGSSSIFGIAFHGQPKLVSTASGDYTITLTLSGARTLTVGGETIRGTPGGLVIVPPDESVRIAFGHDAVIIGVRIPKLVFERKLSRLTGQPASKAHKFAHWVGPSVGTQTIAAVLRQVVMFAERSSQPTQAVGEEVENMLLTALLLNIPGAHTEQIWRPVSATSGQAVQVAAEMIREAEGDLPSVAEIAESVGVSLRRLQAAFHAEFGVTPTRFIRDVRLDKVHEILLQGDREEMTVASVATSMGFGHLGRFSADYRARFGVAPSSTLREAARKQRLTFTAR
mgnify:CR=1 FL=1